MAVNHWQLAIDTHNTNHPTTDHDCVDIRTVHPSAYPYTDIFWASPECTNHSLAKGKKRKNLNQLDLWGNSQVDPSEEKSRATMREVIEFAEYHHNPIVIVENVVDIRYWTHYDDWIQAMINLGYDYRTLYLNAQFFGVPQSRDRWYTVFWLHGNKAPDLDFHPPAYCRACEQWIEAVQSWKKPDSPWGRYGKNRQYVYLCPACAGDVEPGTIPAAAVIDWSIPAPRIGDRERPLREKTMERIRAGLRKFGGQPFDLDMAWASTPYPVDVPLPTQTTRQTLALLQPFLMSYYSRSGVKGDPVSRVDRPIPTIPTEPRHSLIVPPFMLSYYNQENPARAIDEPMYTVAGRNTPALVIPPFIVPFRGTINGIQSPKLADVDPLDAIVGSAIHHGLVIPLRGTAAPKTTDDPLTTIIASAQQHALISPPFTVSVTHSDERLKAVDQPFNTVMPQGNPGLVVPPFVMSYYGSNPVYAGVGEPLPGVTTVQRHALVDPETLIEDCGFRMLEPEELKRGMSFPTEYVILGNKRDQVKQIGNAVCCNVAYWITRQCIASLEGSAA